MCGILQTGCVTYCVREVFLWCVIKCKTRKHMLTQSHTTNAWCGAVPQMIFHDTCVGEA